MDYLSQVSEQSSARLEQLESDWLKGEIPDVASYLHQSTSECPQAWRDLVELDMEYRWRRFQHGTSETDLDPFGFPQYPKLEHYADLLEEPFRSQLLNPELLAEEYRVRTFWGDRPPKQQYFQRFPQDSDQVGSALERIDLEFEIEGMTACIEDVCSEETTELFDQRSAELAETLPGTETPSRIGKYHLKELLGKGGFGEVWKVFDPDLKRYVALKFPYPQREASQELLESFRQEAEKMAALESVPGVVQVFEAGDHDGIPYIVSSFIEGEDLSVRQKNAPLSYEESARVVANVAETLHRAHLKDLFHRDVKLSNILIDRNGGVFLSDFGLCVSEQEQLHEGHSATGTYAYMAPEQIYGNSHRVDGRADIYALGVVLYRLLSGRLPFIGNSSVEYMEQALKKSPRPLRSIDDKIPDELERICTKCLQKKVEDRYSTAGDLSRDLRNWLAGLETGTVSEPAAVSQVNVETQTSFSQDHPFLMALAMLVIAAAGFFLATDLDGKSDNQPPPTRVAANEPAVRDSDRENTSVKGTDAPKEFGVGGLLEELNQEDLVLRDATPRALSEELKDPQWEIFSGGLAVKAKALVDENRFCLRSLGTLEDGGSIEIQIQLREMLRGSSGGIFFGMSEQLFNSPYAHWKTIIIRRERDGTYTLKRQFRQFQTNQISYSSDAPYNTELIIPEDESTLINLGVKISSAGLEEIEVNGQQFPELVDHFRNEFPAYVQQNAQIPPKNFHATGRFGLTCKSSEVIFANPVINNQPRIFKKLE